MITMFRNAKRKLITVYSLFQYGPVLLPLNFVAKNLSFHFKRIKISGGKLITRLRLLDKTTQIR